MMEYVIGAIWIALEMLCIFLFNGAFLHQKEFKKNCIYKVLVIWIIACVYTNFPLNPFVKQILTVTVYTALSMFLLQGSCVIHVCLAVICYIFISAIDTIAIYGMCYLLGISYDTFVWHKFSYVTLTTADKLLVVFSAWLLNHSRKKGNLGKQHSKWVQLSVLFPAVSAVMLAFLFYTAPRDEDVSINVVVLAGILMIANIAMIYVINSLEKATEQEQDLRMLRQQISIQTENYIALKKLYCVQRKSTHEFERHIQVVRDLLDRKEYETAQEYVRQLQADRALKVFSITSNNPVIDVVLNHKHQVAQENGIKMQVKVNDLSSVTIKTNELVVLLSNLLDNAIEACQRKVTHPEIHCSIILEDDLYISIRNTTEPVDIENGVIITTKANPTEHGYGLPAVKYILEQLNAEYTFDYSDGWFQFAAELQL